MKLIVGLGNPGLFYANNRHNIGYMCVNRFARDHKIRFNKKQGLARIGTGEIDGEKVVLARPQTFMNESGEAVSRLVTKYKIGLSDLVVIHDDLDLPAGKLRLRRGRGSGGHKGIESIIAHLGKGDFYRVRVGIGRPDIPEDSDIDKEQAIIDYVLTGFTREEKKIIDGVIPEVSRAILCLLTEGIEAAMNKYN
ncbi:MAG TPA: aminoacyl-tRNA hydrolase [Dehalococcoidia bacterium]|nr:aminoacyl-tRNA hydrolase [Dehalococcoidia bacterium]